MENDANTRALVEQVNTLFVSIVITSTRTDDAHYYHHNVGHLYTE